MLVLEAMRDAMIDQLLLGMHKALQRGDSDHYERLKDQCTRLTNPGWEAYLISARPASGTISEYLVMAESKTGPIVQFRFHDTYLSTVFAVPANEFDRRGWVDPQGLSFYERLRYGGYREEFVWRYAAVDEWEDMLEEFRVLHPRELMYHVKTRRLEVVVKPGKFSKR